MFLSIVTICFNDLAGLRATYESVVKQTESDYEWLVVDGSSTDGSQQFLSGIDIPQLSWRSEKDSGIYDAMNKGINRASGQYIVFMNSGDMFAGCTVVGDIKMFCKAQSMPDFIYGDTYEQTNEGQLLKRAHSHRWIKNGMFAHHQSMFYRIGVIGTQRYDLDYSIVSDFAFTCRFLKKCNSIQYKSIPVSVFQGGGLTSSTKVHLIGIFEQWKVGKNILHSNYGSLLFISLKQIGKHILIRVFPRLHKRVRYEG